MSIDLKEAIELKRKELMMIAKEFGMSSKETIQCSQELDYLILVYQNQYVH